MVHDGVMEGGKEGEGRVERRERRYENVVPATSLPPSPAACFIRLTLSSILHSVQRCHRACPRTSPRVVT